MITQEEKDKINGTYSKEEIDASFAKQDSVYTKEETYTKQEVEEKIPTLVDSYSKEESDARYPQKSETVAKMPESVFQMLLGYVEGGTMTDDDYNTLSGYAQNDVNVYLSEAGTEFGAVKVVINNETSYITVFLLFDAYLEYFAKLPVNKETKEVVSNYKYSIMNAQSDGELEIGNVTVNNGTSKAASVKLLAKGTGSKYLSDDGEYKEIDTSSLAAKADVYTKTEADNKFALASKQMYIIPNPGPILGMETSSNYPINQITHSLGMTLESFLNNGYYTKCYFPNYIARVVQKTYYDDSDVFHFCVMFTFVESDYTKDITIDQAQGSSTCNITAVKKQLVTNIVSISESNYASLSSKDSSTLYLVY
ncbi:MAG: hypothetical protein ACI30I_09005 [Parabacteroides sp.]